METGYIPQQFIGMFNTTTAAAADDDDDSADRQVQCLFTEEFGSLCRFEVAKLAPGSIKSEYLFFESSFVPDLAQRM